MPLRTGLLACLLALPVPITAKTLPSHTSLDPGRPMAQPVPPAMQLSGLPRDWLELRGQVIPELPQDVCKSMLSDPKASAVLSGLKIDLCAEG